MGKAPNKSETIVYRGMTFRRYPQSKEWASRCYYVPGFQWRKQGVQRLHQEIYKDNHGPIPDGYHVHHKDENPLNNDPSNLEALSPDEHRALHASKLTKQEIEALRQHAARVRPKARNWHSTKAGRSWHREHSRQSWEGREAIQKTCQQCGEPFETRDLKSNTRYCSPKCRHYARKASGVDNETRTCAHCGDPFEVNKYSSVTVCSRSCGASLRWATHRQQSQTE